MKKEKIVYLSDTHGNLEALNDLELYLDDPPDHLICLGDHFVTPSFRKIQALFYNCIKNPTKKLLEFIPNASNSDILNCPDGQGSTVKDSYLELNRFEMMLANDFTFLHLTDDQIAANIRCCIQYEHYGLYTSNTSLACKKKLGSELKKNAIKFCTTINKFIKVGTTIDIIEGNQDARTPIDYLPGTFEVIPLPIVKRIFHAGSFLNQQGYHFHDGISTFTTKSTVQVLVAFDETIKAAQSKNYQINKNIAKFIKEERNGKTVVLAVHGMVNTDIFGLGKIPLNKEGTACLTGSCKISEKIKPDIIVHGHYHNPKITEKICTNIPLLYDQKVKVFYLPENTNYKMVFAI